MTRAEELAAIIAENKRKLRELEAELQGERNAAALEACPYELGDILESVSIVGRGRPISLSWVLVGVEAPPVSLGGKPLLLGRRVLKDGSLGKAPPQYIWGELRKVGHMEPPTAKGGAQ